MIIGIFKRNSEKSFEQFSHTLEKESILNDQFYLEIEENDELSLILRGLGTTENTRDLFEKTAKKCNNKRTLFIEYNNRASSLILKNDRFGTVPIYYYPGKDWFIFSTSFFGVLKYLEKKELNADAISGILNFGYVLYDRTIEKNIEKLGYAEKIKISNEAIQRSKYWDFSINEETIEIEKDRVDYISGELANKLEKAIVESLPENGNVLIPLSGGLDSRLILSMVYQNIDVNRIRLFTFGQKGTQDFEFASKVANELGLKHHKEIIPSESSSDFRKINWKEYFEDKIISNSGRIEIIPGRLSGLVTKQILPENMCLLSGFMGDPLYGSHLNAAMFKSSPNGWENDYRKILKKQAKCASSLPFQLNIEGIKDAPQEFINTFRQFKTTAGRAMFWDFAVRQQSYIKFGQIEQYLGEVPVRLPFLDPELFEFSTGSIPMNWKLNEFIYVEAQKKLFNKKLLDIPDTHSVALTLGNNKMKKLFHKAGVKINEKLGHSLLPAYLKKNTVSLNKLIQSQVTFRDFLKKEIQKLEERGLIQSEMSEYVRREMQNDRNAARLACRIATVNVAVEKIG